MARLPEVLLLREVLFKRSELDTRANEFMEIEVPLVHNFWRVKRMIARRLKTQPDPENITLWYMGSELHNKWKLMDGVNCGDTVHVKIKLKNVEATEFVKRRAKFWARVWAYLTEDNIVGIGYIFGFFVLFTALVRWPSDPDRATPLGSAAAAPSSLAAAALHREPDSTTAAAATADGTPATAGGVGGNCHGAKHHHQLGHFR